MTTIFEKAARQKLRFNSPKGQLTVEDLWDLPLTSGAGKACLDAIAIELDQEIKTQTTSFVTDVTPRNTLAQLKFDIVKYVIDTRKAENEAALAATARAAQKSRLLEELAKRQDAQVGQMSEAELRAAIDAL